MCGLPMSFRRRVPAKSCAACSNKSRRDRPSWAIPRRSKILAAWPSSLLRLKTDRVKLLRELARIVGCQTRRLRLIFERRKLARLESALGLLGWQQADYEGPAQDEV